MVSNTGLNRSSQDKYYTKNDVVKICMKNIISYITISENDLCIEPSAGNGSFIKKIKSLFSNSLFYDIAPENDEIIKQDYLELDFDTLIDKYDKIHAIGNPPFGRQSSLAIKFIKHSAKFCNSISFILPKSFKKESLKKHFPLNFHLEFECDLPSDSFTVDDKSHDVPCVFQIWIKKDIQRSSPIKLNPTKYRFVEKADNPDIAFRRVGVYAGDININVSDKSSQSHYFIKFDYPLTDTLLTKLKDLDYSCKNNTVGPKSISKQELIREFNKVF